MKTESTNPIAGVSRRGARLMLAVALVALVFATFAAVAEAKGRPSGTMTINGGSPYAIATVVSIDSAVGNVTQMRFRDAGGSWTSWEPYASSRVWTLPAGDGLKKIEAQYKSTGKAASLSDTIVLDSQAPITTDNNDGLWHSTFILELIPVDAVSGVVATEYRVNGGPWVNGASVLMRILRRHRRTGFDAGANTVEYRSTDNAGNVGAIVTTTVLLDDTPR